MNNPLINILIRTSNRPNSFRRCLFSIEKQPYANVNILVSVDNDYSYDYVIGKAIEPIWVKKQKGEGYYNLYLNELLKHVVAGWIVIVDDDDYLAEGMLPKLAKYIRKAETGKTAVLLARMRWPNDRIIPSDENFGKTVVRGDIGMPCIIFNAETARKVVFDNQKAADFRLAKNLYESGLKINCIDLVVVEVGNTGNGGKAVDI